MVAYLPGSLKHKCVWMLYISSLFNICFITNDLLNKIDTDIWGYLLRSHCQMETPEAAKTILNADNPVCCPQEWDIKSLVLKMPHTFNARYSVVGSPSICYE